MAKKHVLIDIRPLLTSQVSGVTVYIENLLTALTKDKTNKYSLFCNSLKKKQFNDWEKKFKIHYSRYPNKVLNLLVKAKLVKIDRLIGEKVDIFLAPDLRPTHLSKEVKKIQVLHDFSWLRFKHFFSKKTQLWFKLLNPRKEILSSTHIVTVSKAIQNELKKTYSKHPQSTHVEPFIFIKKQIAKETKSEGKYFFYIGTIEPRKNIEKLIVAFKSFQKKHQKIKLIIAGKKNSKIFAKLKISNHRNIKFLGEISEGKKIEYLKNAIALTYPSIYEGFGLPVAESILNGTPCIISSDPALRETAGKAGISTKTDKEIQEALELLVKDKQALQKLRQNCKIETKKWNDKETLKKWLKIFKNI